MSGPEIRASLAERLFAGLQYVLPKHLLSSIVHWLSRRGPAPIHGLAIRVFMRFFKVNMSAAVDPDPRAYANFNDFFTRALRPGARPLAEPADRLVSPVDGRVSQLGSIQGGRLYQAKGRHYQLAELLGDPLASSRFAEGRFITIYLAPYNYHRIHMPLTGRLRAMHFIPGSLFSVNAATARSVPRLFARNERVACLFDGPRGPFFMVLVGALFVGSIETVWAGEITPGGGRVAQSRTYPEDGPDSVLLEQGEEMGRFNMGSTVIVIDVDNGPGWLESLAPGVPVCMGEALSGLPQSPSDAQ